MGISQVARTHLASKDSRKGGSTPSPQTKGGEEPIYRDKVTRDLVYFSMNTFRYIKDGSQEMANSFQLESTLLAHPRNLQTSKPTHHGDVISPRLRRHLGYPYPRPALLLPGLFQFCAFFRRRNHPLCCPTCERQHLWRRRC